MKELNINTMVLVKITETGWHQLHEKHDYAYIQGAVRKRLKQINGSEWLQIELHQVWKLFDFHMGFDPPIETTILINENDLETPENE